MSVQPIRLAVVNDYELVVAGVAAMLAPFSEQVELVELASGVPVASDVDVVLFDDFAQGEGPDLDDLVREDCAKVVVYSWHTDPRLVDSALERGAAGYLHKAVGAEEIVAAVEKVRAGGVVRPDGTPDGLPDGPGSGSGSGSGNGSGNRGALDGTGSAGEADQGGGAWPGQGDGLSPRESEILTLITRGLSNQEIAERTYLSINSVKTYIRTAYRKIGVTRRSQAVAWGMSHGFAPDRSRRRLAD